MIQIAYEGSLVTIYCYYKILQSKYQIPVKSTNLHHYWQKNQEEQINKKDKKNQ